MRWTALLALGPVLLTSCVLADTGARGAGSAMPPRPVSTSVVMSEYRFENEAVLARGPTVFRVENRGSLPHSMTFVALPDDFPPIDEQLRGETRRPASAIARIPLRQPTGRGSFSVNLGPGRYALICFAEDSDGVQHALKGMSSELRVK